MLRSVLPYLPPLRKGGRGGFLKPPHGKSPLTPLFQRGERHGIGPLDPYPGAYPYRERAGVRVSRCLEFADHRVMLVEPPLHPW
jgi:hypothetical protein